jgi:hypothetical protein
LHLAQLQLQSTLQTQVLFVQAQMRCLLQKLQAHVHVDECSTAVSLASLACLQPHARLFPSVFTTNSTGTGRLSCRNPSQVSILDADQAVPCSIRSSGGIF